MHKNVIMVVFIASLLFPTAIVCQEGEAEPGLRKQPLVRGGVYDKPYLYKLATGRAAVGGYAEAHFRFEREAGITEELTFLPKRFNLFMHALISERFRMASELEFEEGTEEINLELAILDFEIHYSLIFRAGMILTPLGKFNLAHDSPANLLTDRPLVSTRIIPTALSEPGMGIYGAMYPNAGFRITYEMYAVNGLHEGIIEDSPEGTRIPFGRHNTEDNNNSPAFAGRIGISPLPEAELGLSWHTGAYNISKTEGLTIEESRNLTILAADWEYRKNRYLFLGEYARASIDIPENFKGTFFAERQQGFYAQACASLFKAMLRNLPESYFSGVCRLDWVDFDSELTGDTHSMLTTGVNFHPTPDSIFKLNYFYSWRRDRFNAETNSAGILFSVATYF